MPSEPPILPIATNAKPPPPPPMAPIKSNTPSIDGLLLQKAADSKDDFAVPRILISHPSYDEDRPLLSRAYSYDGVTAVTTTTTTPTADAVAIVGNRLQKKRRRRTVSHDALLPLSAADRRRDSPTASSFRENFGHAASETYLVTRLSLTLLRYLGLGYRWMTKFLALGCYAALLMPGFVQVGYYYFFSAQVIRSIVYGSKPRNRLDLYLPKNSNGPKPVVAFVTGGAWIIGYKAWGSLLGRHLSERDVIVACIDYRNFPQGTISDMVKDASEGISFVCNHIAEYGGDPNRIYLMGQSAGAHIAACALIEQAIKEARGQQGATWSVSQIKAYFGLSGGYNLLNLVDHFHNRGLYRSIFTSIMEGEESLHRYSPELVVQDPSVRNAVSLLPPIILFHGTADYSIPSDASRSFAETLKSLGAKAESVLYEEKTHTDLFLQDPMRGGKDEMFEDLVAIIHGGDEQVIASDAVAPPFRRLVPEFMLKWARSVSPF